MEKFSLYIKGICLISILGGVLSAVVPSGRMKKSFTSLSAVILVSAIIVPFSNFFKMDFDLDDFFVSNRQENLVSDVRTAEVMMCESVVSEVLEKKLKENGISCRVKIKGEKQKDEFTVSAVSVSGDLTIEEKNGVQQILTELLPEAEIDFREE